ncbi:MAG: hypothetical protein ABIG60_03780 [Patescibacteria group bacterium]
MINIRSILGNIKEFYYNFFSRPCREVIEANLNKLPDKIEVSWFRDDKYIIGNIKTENNEFVTQAISADEFVEMVNDTLMAAYDIPDNCLYILRKTKKYSPTKDQFAALNNAAIKKYYMSISKAKELATA